MARKIVRLTPDLLSRLGQVGVPCRSCVRWELDPVRRGRLTTAVDAAAEKDAWLSLVLREWGSCGRVAIVEDQPVGYVVYAPPAFVPGSAGHPTAPVSPDAVLLTTAYVAPEHARGGLGRMLVQAMAADLVGRGGVRAVEAYGDTRGRGRCVVSADFLAHVGFRTHRAHPTTPRMRMDLRSALTWKDEVEATIERLVGVVRPSASPVPQLRTHETPDG